MISYAKSRSYFSIYQSILLTILLLSKYTNAEQNQHQSLPENHIPFYNAQLSRETNPTQEEHLCWGHEENCNAKSSFSSNFTKCKESSQHTIKSRQNFFNEADFGYVKQRRENLLNICSEQEKDSVKSSIRCTNQLQFCVGKNIRIDFRGIANSRSDGSLRYNMNVLKPGQITAKCQIDKVFYINKLLPGHNKILNNFHIFITIKCQYFPF